MCSAWLLEAACMRLTDKLVLHSLQQRLVCIFRLHGSRTFPCQHGANQVLPTAWKRAQTHKCKLNAAFKMFFLLFALTALTAERCSWSTHRDSNLKKKVAFLTMFPLQKFPAGLGISNHPSINSTTSVRSVPLHCSWLAAQFQNASAHATKFQPLFTLQFFSFLI